MEPKQKVGIKAAEFIENDMIVGLGTGSTAYFFVQEIGRKLREGELTIKGAVVTSEATRIQAIAEGIPLLTLGDIEQIDVTVDGTDEFDPQLNGIKGGGGALLIEKIIAINSKEVIWIADESKRVEQLGAFPLPIEIIKVGSKQLIAKLAALGYNQVLRLGDNGEPYLTDENNYIVDLHLTKIENAQALADQLENMVGVVEHGLFLNIAAKVLVTNGDEVELINK